MLTLITGAPGAGKTAALVDMLKDLGNGRILYVNGIPDLKIPHETLVDPATWPDTVPDGSVIIIDEVQNVWRPSGPGQRIPESITKLETHRHRGLDIYVITQGPNLVHSNVRALVGRHVHLRDLGLLGRWWYEWPECADNCRTAWKNAPIKKRYRLPKRIFDQYKSSSLHVKPVRSVPWMLAVMVAALLTVAVMSWLAYGAIQRRMNPNGTKPAETVPAVVNQGQQQLGPAAHPPPAAQPQKLTIDDRVDWIPRVSTRPESAPAYDHLRKVVAFPRVTGAMCVDDKCKCYTQQRTVAEITEDQCRAWAYNRPFDPYKPDPGAPGATADAPQSNPAAADPA